MASSDRFIPQRSSELKRNRPVKPKPSPKVSRMNNDSLEWSGRNAETIDEDVFENKDIKKCFMSKNLISALPERFTEFTNLTLLDLSYNRLNSIPEFFSQLGSLKTLMFVGNRITTFPSKFPESLAKLDLSFNYSPVLPVSLCTSCPNLEYLNISHNHLTSLPDEFSQLSSLSSLVAFDNRLTTLPDSFCSLSALIDLDLSKNQITHLPERFGSLTSIHEFKITNNHLKDLPNSFGEMESLRILHLGFNEIEEIPDSLSKIPSLEMLKLNNNRIKSINPTLWQCTTLEQLDLTSNHLTEISPEIGALVGMTDLLLAMNHLTSIPDTIAQLENLTILNVFGNHIEVLPSNLQNLTKLKQLYVSYNNLVELPEFQGLNLEEFHCSGNPNLSYIPFSLFFLGSLSRLSMSDVSLEYIPEVVVNLHGVEKIDFSHNLLTHVPDPFGQLMTLQHVDLSHNDITSITENLDQWWEIETIDLSNNRKLKDLPALFQKFAGDRGVLIHLDCNEVDKVRQKPKLPPAGNSNRWTVGWSETTGRRTSMEDTFAIRGALGGQNNWDLFAVFDGHGGKQGSEFATWVFPELLRILIQQHNFEPERAIKKAFEETNKRFQEYVKSHPAARHAGTTGQVSLIVDNTIYLANVGDSRAVLGKRETDADGHQKLHGIRLSHDHKPYDPEEEDRIRGLNGYVMGEVGRVNGQLAVSRSIGDFYMQPFVTCEPFVNQVEITDQDEFLILACDGVWDVLSDQEAVEIVARANGDPARASTRLRDAAYLLGSDDNISVIVVNLKPKKPEPPPKPSALKSKSSDDQEMTEAGDTKNSESAPEAQPPPPTSE